MCRLWLVDETSEVVSSWAEVNAFDVSYVSLNDFLYGVD